MAGTTRKVARGNNTGTGNRERRKAERRMPERRGRREPSGHSERSAGGRLSSRAAAKDLLSLTHGQPRVTQTRSLAAARDDSVAAGGSSGQRAAEDGSRRQTASSCEQRAAPGSPFPLSAGSPFPVTKMNAGGRQVPQSAVRGFRLPP